MSTIAEYLNSLKGDSIAVIGMGVSNTPLIKMMLRAGLKVTVCDKSERERVSEQVAELESLGARFQLGEHYLEKLYRFDIVFRTPGLSPNHPALLEAADRGTRITSEMELFFQLCPCRILAVTGSDGKTTTTTLISEFLKEAGYNVYVGGNIGKPLLPDVADMLPDDMVVLELSSFQLMSMRQSPDVAVFTNLSPNHLDYHHTMEEYTNAKLNIFCHQDESGRAVFNYDNDITRELAKQAPGSMTYFSRRESLNEGVYLRGNAIWLNNSMGNREVLPLDMIRIPGVHNIENYMAAIAAVDGIVADKCVRAAPKLLLDAHLDEIGFIITGHEEGYLRFAPLGGVDPRMLPDRELTIMTQPPMYGVVACLPPHIQTAEDMDKSLPIRELWLDVGLTQEEAERRIPIGTTAVYRTGCAPLGKDLLCGKALDDRACFAILVDALERLKGEELDVDVYLLGSVQEETHSTGAITAAFGICPDLCVAVDVTHGDSPDAPKDQTFKLGSGPAIGIGPNCTRWMSDRFTRCAAELEMEVNHEIMAGHSGTNGWDLQISREGVATAVLSLPLRYMHTPVETIHRSDLENTAALLAQFIRGLGEEVPCYAL